MSFIPRWCRAKSRHVPSRLSPSVPPLRSERTKAKARPGLTLKLLPIAILLGAAPGDLVVEVAGVRDGKGLVHVDICREAEFLKACAISATAPAVQGTTEVTVPNISPGSWAAQAYHDRNANGEVDRGLLGIPRESVGFSNDAPIRLGPPKFVHAAFARTAGAQRILIHLHRFP